MHILVIVVYDRVDLLAETECGFELFSEFLAGNEAGFTTYSGYSWSYKQKGWSPAQRGFGESATGRGCGGTPMAGTAGEFEISTASTATKKE